MPADSVVHLAWGFQSTRNTPSLHALADVTRGFLDHEGTPSPVPCGRSLVDGVWCELFDGSIMTRRVP